MNTFLEDVKSFFGAGTYKRGYGGQMGPEPGFGGTGVHDGSDGYLSPHSDGSPFTPTETTKLNEYWYNKTEDNSKKVEEQEDRREENNRKNSFTGMAEDTIVKVAMIGAGLVLVTQFIK